MQLVQNHNSYSSNVAGFQKGHSLRPSSWPHLMLANRISKAPG